MQILGKRSRILLIAIAVLMLVAVGMSLAMWDMSAVKATNGDLNDYANAKVGDIIEFGQYYQTGKRVNNDENGEYEKTPIEWIVVDKDERTGQLTLMSKYILACGSYFGNWYDDGSGSGYNWYYNNKTTIEIGGISCNQAYVDSTARAFLNNLERLDMGGDIFDPILGYVPSGVDSTTDGYDKTEVNKFVKGSGLLSSIGFSNQNYWTKLNTTMTLDLDGKAGFYKRPEKISGSYYEYYYRRPISNVEYKNRPITRGFFDEAFSEMQKTMIAPKEIAGYTGNRWPDSGHNSTTKSYVEGAVDKVWLPSATELNIINGKDWNDIGDDSWTNPTDEASSTVFEYFKNYNNFTNPVTGVKNILIEDAIKTIRTELAKDGNAGNYSIPVYDKGTTTAKTAISDVQNRNTSDNYWTRTPSSYWYNTVRTVTNKGRFGSNSSHDSYNGVRPCIILKY